MGKRILVVENDGETRALLCKLLEKAVYEVDLASDGLIVWEKLTLMDFFNHPPSMHFSQKTLRPR